MSGLALGGLYATVAVCLTLMAQLARVVNFAQVAFAMFGTYAAVTLADLGLPVSLAIACGVLVGTVASGILGAVVAKWMPEADITRHSPLSIASLLLTPSSPFLPFGPNPNTPTPP